MTLPREIPAVLVVSDDPAVRARAREAIADQARYVFACRLEDVPALMRSVYIHTVVFVGERKEPVQVARLRETLASSRIPARRLILASSPESLAGALASVGD